MADDPAKKEDPHARYEARQMERLQTDVKLGEIGFGPVFEVGRGDMFGGLLGASPNKFTSCRGCGAVIRMDETIEVEGADSPIVRGVWEHARFHERIGDPLEPVSEG